MRRDNKMTNQETDNFNVYKSDVAFMLISPFILSVYDM